MRELVPSYIPIPGKVRQGKDSPLDGWFAPPSSTLSLGTLKWGGRAREGTLLMGFGGIGFLNAP